MPSLTRRPRLLELHHRHMALVGREHMDGLDTDVKEAVRDPAWFEGLGSSIDVFGACGPLHERAGLTPSERLRNSYVPQVQQQRQYVGALPPKLDLAAQPPLSTRRNLRGRSEKVAVATRKFDDNHSVNAKRMGRTLIALRHGDDSTTTKRHVYEFTQKELRYNKYVEPYELAGMARVVRNIKKVEQPAWRIEESVWKARAKWADSGTWLDTPDVYWQAFQLDLARALTSHGLIKFIHQVAPPMARFHSEHVSQ